MNMRTKNIVAVAALGVAAFLAAPSGGSAADRPSGGNAADRIVFGTDWRAQAEHGGFYQALATGLYRDRGLDVIIRQGGPQINHSLLLAAGRVDFSLSSTSFMVLNYVKQSIPMVAVAAMFQKDPQVLIAHPGQGNNRLKALKGKPIYIGSDTRVGSWQFLKSRFGYTDNQIRPYTFSIAPFLANKNVIQQGYLGSEPFLIERQGIKPVVMLLADAGYSGYAALLQTSRKLVEERPKVVRRFVEASIEGWYEYLFGDPARGNELIKFDNPDMPDELLAYGRRKLVEREILHSGDAARLGIGAMNDNRWRKFHRIMSRQGLYPRKMDYRQGFLLRFVNKRVGLKRQR
jgi:NitT/TauT family transport system substrate-binding protein